MDRHVASVRCRSDIPHRSDVLLACVLSLCVASCDFTTSTSTGGGTTPAATRAEGTTGGGEPEPPKHATTDGTTGQDSDTESDPGTSTSDEEPSRATTAAGTLSYGHDVSWDFSRGDGGMTLAIRVSGAVPLRATDGGRVAGSGRLDVRASFRFWSDSDRCDCSLRDVVQAEARGASVEGALAIEVRESWYTRSQWRCQCNEPDETMAAQMSLRQMPSYQPQGLVDRTLRFVPGCSGTISQPFVGQGGSGHYRWSYAPASAAGECAGATASFGPPLQGTTGGGTASSGTSGGGDTGTFGGDDGASGSGGSGASADEGDTGTSSGDDGRSGSSAPGGDDGDTGTSSGANEGRSGSSAPGGDDGDTGTSSGDDGDTGTSGGDDGRGSGSRGGTSGDGGGTSTSGER